MKKNTMGIYPTNTDGLVYVVTDTFTAILAEEDATALADEFRAERESAEREDRGNQ